MVVILLLLLLPFVVGSVDQMPINNVVEPYGSFGFLGEEELFVCLLFFTQKEVLFWVLSF